MSRNNGRFHSFHQDMWPNNLFPVQQYGCRFPPNLKTISLRSSLLLRHFISSIATNFSLTQIHPLYLPFRVVFLHRLTTSDPSHMFFYQTNLYISHSHVSFSIGGSFPPILLLFVTPPFSPSTLLTRSPISFFSPLFPLTIPGLL